MKKLETALNVVLQEIKIQEESTKIKDRSNKGVRKRKSDLSHLKIFLREFDLVPGTSAKIEPRIIAYLYFKKFTKVKDVDKVNWYILFREMGRMLGKGRWGRRRFFSVEKGVNDEIKKEAKDYFDQIKKTQKYERSRNAKKVPIYW